MWKRKQGITHLSWLLPRFLCLPHHHPLLLPTAPTSGPCYSHPILRIIEIAWWLKASSWTPVLNGMQSLLLRSSRSMLCLNSNAHYETVLLSIWNCYLAVRIAVLWHCQDHFSGCASVRLVFWGAGKYYTSNIACQLVILKYMPCTALCLG